MRYAALLLLLLLGGAESGMADEAFRRVSGTRLTGYIVPKAVGDTWMRTYNDPKWLDEGRCWEPSESEAIAAEKAVRDLVIRAQKEAKIAFPGHSGRLLVWDRKRLAEVAQKYPRYEVQFIGIMVKGKKEIFCNFFCRDVTDRLDPSRNFISVSDGGSCFWNIEYILDTKTCTGLDINGEA